jgi:hypothetical protein
MRTLLVAASLTLLVRAAWADEVTDLRDHVLKAAAKNPADIEKYRIFTLKCKGTSKLGDEPLDSTFELVGVYSGKLKATWKIGGGANTTEVTICANDDRGWRKALGFTPIDLPIDDLNDFRADAFAVWASTLITLTHPDTKLSLAGTSKVGGTAVVGLKLTRRPYPEVTLYFDEKTYLLRKMSYRSRENGVVLAKEMIYGGHKEVNGLMLPTTQSINVQGREVYVWSQMEFGFPDKLDGKTFDKP